MGTLKLKKFIFKDLDRENRNLEHKVEILKNKNNVS